MLVANEGDVIDYYNQKIREMHQITYGGSIRSLKGKLVENLCEGMTRLAWRNIGGSPRRISMDRRKHYFYDGKGNRYGLSQDKQVYIDGEFVLSVECKAYAELAMYKRVIVDSYILLSRFPELNFCLFMLESMLGGDYAKDPAHPKGSPAVHVINSLFEDVRIELITMLDGERRVEEPIHKEEYYKQMRPERVRYAMGYFEGVLKEYL